jgi:hypothetical protein
LEELVSRKPELPVSAQTASHPGTRQEWHPKEARSSGLSVEEKMRDLKISEDHKKENSQASTVEKSEVKAQLEQSQTGIPVF